MAIRINNFKLRKEYPRKQGLRRIVFFPFEHITLLRKEYPRKQGLRLDLFIVISMNISPPKGISTKTRIKTSPLEALYNFVFSERNIHENKD